MTKKKPDQIEVTWLMVSRAFGLLIVLMLLLFFLIASAIGWKFDRTLILAFLSIASWLLGIPAAIQIIRRNGQQK